MPRALTALVLLLGIAAVSTASLFVRFAQQGAPSLAIAAGRMAIATLVLAPVAIARHRPELRRLAPRDLALAVVAGVFLALHFATWIASLETTTVASSVVLVTTSPLWVALLSPLVLRERLSAGTVLGIALALCGAAVIALGDSSGLAAWPAHSGARGSFTTRALHGDLLALAGAWAMAGYLLAGRRLRARLALLPYVFVVYGMAAAVLVGISLAAGAGPMVVQGSAWRWIALLALVPQLIGHSSFNWALRHLPTAFVSIALLGEPVGAALLAFALLGESPGAATLAGATLTLAGIAVASRPAWRAIGAPSSP